MTFNALQTKLTAIKHCLKYTQNSYIYIMASINCLDIALL